MTREFSHLLMRFKANMAATPLWTYVKNWRQVTRERAALSRLDAHLLEDIGKTPTEARQEAERPFWDAPNHWR